MVKESNEAYRLTVDWRADEPIDKKDDGDVLYPPANNALKDCFPPKPRIHGLWPSE